MVGDIPLDLQADDGIGQDEVEQMIALDQVGGTTLIAGFEGARPQKVKLSTLQEDFMADKRRTAIQRMQKRQRVEIDGEFLFEKNDPMLAWGAREHFLDYYLLVPGKRGLHAVLPTARGDVSYTFNLDVHRREKQWRARYGDLGFNPTKRMLYIGKYHQEEIWLAMVPRSFVGDDLLDDAEMGANGNGANALEESKDTSLSEEEYCQMIAYLAYHLKKQTFRDIYLLDDFPDLTIESVRESTNLM